MGRRRAVAVAVLFALVAALGGARAARAQIFLPIDEAQSAALVNVSRAAAGLSALYLWQERRLKRREASILRLRAPSLARLDEVSARTIALATARAQILAGIGFGIAENSETLQAGCARSRGTVAASGTGADLSWARFFCLSRDGKAGGFGRFRASSGGRSRRAGPRR